MDENLRNFISKEERAQMDALVARAARRKERRKEADAGSRRIQFFKCECGRVGEMEEKDDVDEEGYEEDFYGGMNRLLREICSFCLMHGLCKQSVQEKSESVLNAWKRPMKSFPFDASAFKQQETASREFYQSGRMDMLFSLVDVGAVELNVAADFAGMSVEDANDMLQGWIMEQNLQDLFGEEREPDDANFRIRR